MDQKSMGAAYTVAQMEAEHFSGGFFSPDVRLDFEAIKDTDAATKQELYRDAFSEAFTLATEIRSHPRYVKRKADEVWSYVDGQLVEHGSERGVVDLSVKGLGTVTISTTEGPQDKDTGLPGYKGLSVRVDSFSPDPKFHLDEEEGFRKLPKIKGLIYEQDHPKHWNAEWLLHEEGSEVQFRDVEEQDAALLGILDYIETLRGVNSVLGPSGPQEFEESPESQAVYDSLLEGTPDTEEGQNLYFLGNGFRASLRRDTLIDGGIKLSLFDGNTALSVSLGVSSSTAIRVGNSLGKHQSEASVPTSELAEVAKAIGDTQPVRGSEINDWYLVTSKSVYANSSVDYKQIMDLIFGLAIKD